MNFNEDQIVDFDDSFDSNRHNPKREVQLQNFHVLERRSTKKTEFTQITDRNISSNDIQARQSHFRQSGEAWPRTGHMDINILIPPSAFHILHAGEDASNQQFREEKSLSKGRKDVSHLRKRKPKNQYDKNMFGYISHIVIKKMLDPQYEQEIQRYCAWENVQINRFFDYFQGLVQQKGRIGTSELEIFFSSPNISRGFKKVFAYFLVRYLKEDYFTYVIAEGRMKEPLKYLQCATKMIYIPRLQRKEYARIFDGFFSTNK